MRGYKGMTKDMTCRNMQFEVGKTYHVDGEIKLCKNGLHFCQNLTDVFRYYQKDEVVGHRFFEVETNKPVLSDGVKSVTAELTILRELTDIEVNRAYYSGEGTGNSYSGYSGNGHGNGYYNGCYSNYEEGNGYGDGYGGGDGIGYCHIQNILVFNN